MSEVVIANYRAGAGSRFLAWVDRLPWHGWWVFPALAVVLFAWAHGVLWVSGRVAAGTIDPTITAGLVYGPYALGALALANRIALRSLDAFWPATGWPDSARPAWAYQLVTAPGGLGWLALAIGVPIAIGAFLSAPPDFLGAADTRWYLVVAYLPIMILGYSAFPLVVAHTVRQLRLVARIHREATAIDPFDREPVYAFSRLTVFTGLAYVLIGYYAMTVNGTFQSGNVVSIAALVASFVAGIVTFVVPLWGIHSRLALEKAVLLAQVEARLSKVAAEMYRRIDASEFGGTKEITDTLAGVTVLRERVARLPTWPWPPQLLRGFLSALLAPVVVYVLARLISAQFGT